MADAGRIVIIPKGEYKNNVTYERLDAVLYNGKGYIALKTVTGVTPAADGENWQIYVDNVNIDVDNLKPNFEISGERKNIFSGETLSAIFGKIKKYFSDIKEHAFKDLATTFDVEEIGTGLDAIAGKELNDKMNTNGYGEFAGGKNLFNGLFITPLVSIDKDYTNINLTEYADCHISKSCMDLTYCTFGGFFKKGTYTFSYTNNAYFSLNRIAIAGTACKGSAGLIRKSYTWTQNVDGYTYFGIEGDKSVGDGTDTPFSKTPDIQIEEGDTSTSYEPYFPSNKMLHEENIHQSTEMMDIKMLGWSVPRNCPIQNEIQGNQFIQKVGRVNLGSLKWTMQSSGIYHAIIATIKPHQNNMILNGYTTWRCDTAVSTMENKSIKMSGFETDKIIYVRDDSFKDIDSFKAAMQGKYLYYELSAPITTSVDGNEIGETVDNVRKETTVNLLNCTLQTVTKNGVTCTNNGDGTYTLNGTATASDNFAFRIGNAKVTKGVKYKLVAYSDGSGLTLKADTDNIYLNNNNKYTFTAGSDTELVMIGIVKGTTFNKRILKPLLTTNLQATYDDFVPYTGDTGSLNSDVASLLKRIQALESQSASATSKLCSDAIDDLASVVSTQDEAIDELATIVTESEEK